MNSMVASTINHFPSFDSPPQPYHQQNMAFVEGYRIVLDES